MNKELLHLGEDGERYVFDPSSEAGDPVEKQHDTEKKGKTDPSQEKEESEPQGSDDVLIKNGEVVK